MTEVNSLNVVTLIHILVIKIFQENSTANILFTMMAIVPEYFQCYYASIFEEVRQQFFLSQKLPPLYTSFKSLSFFTISAIPYDLVL